MDFSKSLNVAMEQFEAVYLMVGEMDARRDTHDNMSKFERMKIAVEVLSLIDFREKEIEPGITNINF